MVAQLEATQRDESTHGPPAPRLALHWVWPEERAVWLQGARLGIGRDADCDLPLDGVGVSRHHAELYRQGPLYVVRDLGSTNGTWLDGRRIEHAPVAAGSVLRVGDWVGLFRLMGNEAPPLFTELAPGLFGGGEIAAALAPLRRVASTDLPVLLTGATGTGKERFAHAVHHFSGRSGPFIAVNCAALPEQLAEAELFGYRRGAYTGAEHSSIGHFRASNGGMLFLDEVAELPLALQPKLLRALENRNVQGLGEASPIAVDMRIVSAVQKPVAELIASGKLREDLAARLCGLQVRLPSLSQRKTDIAGLFAQFLKENSGGRPPQVESRLIEALCLHDWPQNVRALELTTRALLAVHGHEPLLKYSHLPQELASDPAASAAEAGAMRDRKDHDRAALAQALRSSGGNVTAAATSLGISRQRVYRLLDGQSVEALLKGKGDDGSNR